MAGGVTGLVRIHFTTMGFEKHGCPHQLILAKMPVHGDACGAEQHRYGKRNMEYAMEQNA